MRTSKYFNFSGNPKNQDDLDRLHGLRIGASKRNKHRIYGSRVRVCVKPRLGKNSPYRHLYNRISRQTVKWEHAATFDVYVRNY